jgi:hypothetical protein
MAPYERETASWNAACATDRRWGGTALASEQSGQLYHDTMGEGGTRSKMSWTASGLGAARTLCSVHHTDSRLYKAA